MSLQGTSEASEKKELYSCGHLNSFLKSGPTLETAAWSLARASHGT